MEDRIHHGKVNAYVWTRCPPPPGRGRPKSASGGPCSPNGAFLGKLYKTKVEEHAQFSGDGSSQIRSQTSPRCPAGGPSARGASADLVPWLFGLKLGREMSTHPGRSTPVFGTPPPRSGGPNNGVPGSRCSGIGFSKAVWDLQRVLKMHRAKPGTPASYS